MQEALRSAGDLIESQDALPRVVSRVPGYLLPHLLLVVHELGAQFMMPVDTPAPGIGNMQEAISILVSTRQHNARQLCKSAA